MLKRIPLYLGLLLGALLALGGAGCGSSSKTSAEDPEAIHLKKVADLIEESMKAHQQMPPADIEELKSWAIKEGKAEDKDFLSTRDKESYVILYPGSGKPKKGALPILLEAKGKDGLKYMVKVGSEAPHPANDQYLQYSTGGMLQQKPRNK
jgi:hypothetical protein